MSCAVGSDPILLWLWLSLGLWPVAIATIQPLAWELPYAIGAALKRKKKTVCWVWDIGLTNSGWIWQNHLHVLPQVLEPKRILVVKSILIGHQYLNEYFENQSWITFYWGRCFAEIDRTEIIQVNLCVLAIKIFSSSISYTMRRDWYDY